MNVTSSARIGAHVLNVALVVAAMVLLQGRAEASCAGPARPSAYSFVGTVVAVEHNGVTATVRTDRGREVTVVGSPSPSEHGATSVDRRFAVGARYEFHPLNAASPYQDDACTATRQLSGPKPAPLSAADDRLPGWLPVDEDAGPMGYVLLAMIVVGLLAAAAGGRWAWRSTARGRRSGVPSSGDS